MLLLGELSDESTQSRPVAVKQLRDEYSFEARLDFYHEVKVMASFNHENILGLIGIVRMGTSLIYIYKLVQIIYYLLLQGAPF